MMFIYQTKAYESWDEAIAAAAVNGHDEHQIDCVGSEFERMAIIDREGVDGRGSR